MGGLTPNPRNDKELNASNIHDHLIAPSTIITSLTFGKSSFQIQVDAYAEGRMYGRRLACTALITMVAVCRDENGDLQKLHHGKTVD